MTTQQCLILIKPDGLTKSLTGNILTALSETRLIIVGSKLTRPSKEIVENHYFSHKDKPFFGELVSYLTGKFHTERVLALVYQGENAIEKIRSIVGSANPEEAAQDTIRGRYGRINSKTKVFENVIHASDSEETAEREIKLWFNPDELVHTIYPSEKISKTSEVTIWK